MCDFNWRIYRELNKDLIDAGLNTRDEIMSHWNNFGKYESRKTKITDLTSDFNWRIYGHENPDLGKARFISQTDIEIHWIRHGQYEQRVARVSDITPDFNYEIYALLNPDLKTNKIIHKHDVEYHWVKHGIAEKREYKGENIIVVRYCIERDWPNNFGDGINPIIFEYFTKKNIYSSNCLYGSKHNTFPSILGIGSIMQHMNSTDIIFGTGTMDIVYKLTTKPKKVVAVRGPLTRKYLLDNGIECPEIYGDPALLLPFMYYPKIEKRYKLGIIPHYLDKKIVNNMISANNLGETNDMSDIDNTKNDNVKIIDVQSSNEYEKFINELLSCEYIVSSSLHGIIVGDAYNIPSYPCYFGKASIENMKFTDYCMSVGRNYHKIIYHNDISNMIEQMKPYKCSVDIKKLIDIFPYIDQDIKNKCLEELSNGFLEYLQ